MSPSALFSWSGVGREIDVFCDWVREQPRYAWIKGITLHHTAVPALAQWRGQRSVNGAKTYYRDVKGWSAGPHLFIASDTINDGAYEGVWQGTPLNVKGVHAGACNSSMLGVEVVGNYNSGPWSAKLKADVYQVLDALYDWTGLKVNPETLKGHRECMTGRDCPGWYVNMDTVRHELNVLRSSQPAFIEFLVKWRDSRVRRWPYSNMAVTRVLQPTDSPIRAIRKDVVGSKVTLHGITSDKWVQLLEGDYIWSGLVQENDTIL